MAAKKAAKRSNGIRVDFTGVSAEGGSVLFPEGLTMFEVEEITQETSESSGNDYLAAKLRCVEGKYEGKFAYDNLSLQPQALWKLRQLMEAGGLEVEDAEMDLDPEELVGLNVMAEVVHEEYKGKPKTRIAGYSSVDNQEQEEAEEEQEKPTRRAAKKTSTKEAEEDEPAFKVKQKVKFKDGKKWVTGTITAIEDDVITVKAGNEEYEMGPEDLEAA